MSVQTGVQLQAVAGPGAGQRWALPTQPGLWTIGSAAGCHIVLGGDTAVAAEHARLARQDDRLLIAPLGGPVLHNGRPISAWTELSPHDRITLGQSTLSLTPAEPAQPQPATAAVVGVALPPPDPPRWRWLVALVAVVLAAAAVTAVVQLLPRGPAQPAETMDPAVLARVKAATVWVRAVTAEAESEGSGYVCAPGYVATNAHVVMDAGPIEVLVGSGTPAMRTLPARLVQAGQPGTPDDVAVLAVDTTGLQPLRLAEEADLGEGVPVAAFGYPLGSTLSTGSFGPAISVRGGYITALRRGDEGRIEWVESDLAAEVGNSGGPVVTLEGHVVGLATMIVGPHLKIVLIAPPNRLARYVPTS